MLHCSLVQMAGSEQMLFLSGVKRLKWRPELFSQSPLNRHYRTSSPITDQFLSSTRDLSEMMLGTLLQSKISAPISSQRNEWSLREVWGPSGLLVWDPSGLLLLVLLLALILHQVLIIINPLTRPPKQYYCKQKQYRVWSSSGYLLLVLLLDFWIRY